MNMKMQVFNYEIEIKFAFTMFDHYFLAGERHIVCPDKIKEIQLSLTRK